MTESQMRSIEVGLTWTPHLTRTLNNIDDIREVIEADDLPTWVVVEVGN